MSSFVFRHSGRLVGSDVRHFESSNRLPYLLPDQTRLTSHEDGYKSGASYR